MAKPKLTYFDIAGSRGEECRLALHLGGIDFEDVRVSFPEWAALKEKTPHGSLPVLELPGQPPLAETNAILVLVGRKHGLHPKDELVAARHESLMSYAETLRNEVARTLGIKDDAEKEKARKDLASGFMQRWAKNVEQQLGDGPFVGGEAINVVDLKLFMLVRWFVNGTVDHIPADVFDAYPKLKGVYDAVAAHDGVKAWYAR